MTVSPYVLYTGDGVTALFSVPFPYIDESDVYVLVNGGNTTDFVFVNATTIEMTTAPGNGVPVDIYRDTDDSGQKAVFYPGATIRAQDLNACFEQSLYCGQETAYIAATATTGDIAPGGITTALLADSAVNAQKLAAGAVTQSKMADASIGSAELINSSVNADKLASGSVTEIKILDGSVTANKLGTGSVTATKIGAGAVTGAKLETNIALPGSPTTTTQTTADNTTKVATTAFVQAAAVQSGPLAGFRNAVINGGFDVWQRSANYSGSNIGYRSADRWQTTSSGGTGANYIIQRHANGTIDGVANQVYCRWNVSVAGSSYTRKSFQQRIEDVRTFAGKQVTLSFKVKGTFSEISTVWLLQNMGTGGSGSVNHALVSSAPVTGSWTTLSYTTTLEDLVGATIGDDSHLELRLDMPPGEAAFLDITQVQLELGPVATPFERRPIGAELALCQRYYWTTDEVALKGGANQRRYASSGSAAWDGGGCTFPVQMRAVPTSTIVGTPTVVNGTVISVLAVSLKGARIGVSVTGAGLYVWSGASVSFDSEL